MESRWKKKRVWQHPTPSVEATGTRLGTVGSSHRATSGRDLGQALALRHAQGRTTRGLAGRLGARLLAGTLRGPRRGLGAAPGRLGRCRGAVGLGRRGTSLAVSADRGVRVLHHAGQGRRTIRRRCGGHGPARAARVVGAAGTLLLLPLLLLTANMRRGVRAGVGCGLAVPPARVGSAASSSLLAVVARRVALMAGHGQVAVIPARVRSVPTAATEPLFNRRLRQVLVRIKSHGTPEELHARLGVGGGRRLSSERRRVRAAAAPQRRATAAGRSPEGAQLRERSEVVGSGGGRAQPGGQIRPMASALSSKELRVRGRNRGFEPDAGGVRPSPHPSSYQSLHYQKEKLCRPLS
jgi:hypothetical protein